MSSKAAFLGCLLVGWFVFLCLVPDPRPLAAPEAFVRLIRGGAGVSDAVARAVATIVLRATGIGAIGILVSLLLGSTLIDRPAARWLGLLIAPLLAVASLWINFGYFPVAQQFWLAIVSAIAGGLLGLALQRSWIAAGILAGLSAALFIWGTATQISDELDTASRLTGLHILAYADDIPRGDAGFTELLRIAFAYAEDNSHGRNPVLPNRAAILALGVILGEDRVAQVARRRLEPDNQAARLALRRRVTLRGRHDLSQHFWVSAALAVLTDAQRSLSIGILKEMKDSTPGGSGFSFVDMAANKAGIRFAQVATQDAPSARSIQMRIAQGYQSDDFAPHVADLPEGLSQEAFQSEFGGLSGAKSRRLLEEISRRVGECKGLR